MSTPKVIKSLQHPLVKHLVKLRSQKKYREATGRLLITSSTLIHEVAKHRPIRMLLRQEKSPMYSGFTPDEEVMALPEILKKISGLETSIDWAAEVDLPTAADLSSCKRLLVLDRLADPGNVGTLARTALALGWDGLFLTEGTADLFNDKALRAARAAPLILPYARGTQEQLLELLAGGFSALIADTSGTPIQKLAHPQKLALILSSEAHGPDPALEAVGRSVTIPMPGQMESLNVAIAGAILTYSLSRET